MATSWKSAATSAANAQRLGLRALLAAMLSVALPTATATRAALGAEPRFTALLENGIRVSGPEAHPWHSTNSQPRLGDTLLLDPRNHVRWLRDNSLPLPQTPSAWVEFVGGDRLPGLVTAFVRGRENPLDIAPPHLLVETNGAYDWPEQRRGRLRVSTRWVRRIVWKHRLGSRLLPGTVAFADGRQRTFRALRFEQDSVRVLLEDGAEEVPFTQLAELHLPAQDAWQAYCEQLAVLAPDAGGRLLRVETTDGLRATASTTRFQAAAFGSHDVDRWYHLLQPAWALDPLWVHYRTIQFRCYSERHVVPLSDFEPAFASGARGDGSQWRWQADRNVRGQVMRSGGQGHGRGLGTQAQSQLHWQLPPGARAFRTRVGLDEIAGRGGCARAVVVVNDNVRLFQSPLLIGSSEVHDTGLLDLQPHQRGGVKLTLLADAAHRERPAGADPLNIRDFVDWIEPEVLLDSAWLQAQVQSAAPLAISAWQGWTPLAGEAIDLVNRWDATRPASPSYRLQVAPRSPLWTLTREMKVPADSAWLALAVFRLAEGTTPARLNVVVDDMPLGNHEVPVRQNQDEPDPILLRINGMGGRNVRVRITTLPLGGQALCDWHGIALLDRPPGLLPLLPDRDDTLAAFDSGTGEIHADSEVPYSGRTCLRLEGADRAATALPGLPVRIRQRPRLGEFRFLRFAWRKSGGGRIGLQLGHDGIWGPTNAESTQPRESFRYDAGGGPPTLGAAVRLAGVAPENWTLITRDLFADFGEFELTGLSLVMPDGKSAWLDHVYLARTPDDLKWIQELPADN